MLLAPGPPAGNVSLLEYQWLKKNVFSEIKLKKKQAQCDTDQKYKHENKERTADLKQTVCSSSVDFIALCFTIQTRND